MIPTDYFSPGFLFAIDAAKVKAKDAVEELRAFARACEVDPDEAIRVSRLAGVRQTRQWLSCGLALERLERLSKDHRGPLAVPFIEGLSRRLMIDELNAALDELDTMKQPTASARKTKPRRRS